jgi:hypothetical protein
MYYLRSPYSGSINLGCGVSADPMRTLNKLLHVPSGVRYGEKLSHSTGLCPQNGSTAIATGPCTSLRVNGFPLNVLKNKNKNLRMWFFFLNSYCSG